MFDKIVNFLNDNKSVVLKTVGTLVGAGIGILIASQIAKSDPDEIEEVVEEKTDEPF